jgi:hypothetical protein
MPAPHSFDRWVATGVLTLSLLAVALVSGSGAQTPAPKQAAAEPVELLFVQNSVAGSYDGKTLTLNGVGPTIFFSDRPQRVTGQVRTAEFIGHWDKGSDNFGENPPNASLSIFGAKEIQTAIVELTSPKLKGNTLSYRVKVLKGRLPASFKESSLFIDILGRWRMAAMGMAVGEARGEQQAQAQYAYHPAPAPPPAPAPAAPAPAAAPPAPPKPVYSAPPPAESAPTSAAAVSESQAATVAKLKELKSLLNQGLITQGQYETQSQKLLNELVQ